MKAYYADFGPTLATEALEERHGITFGPADRPKWMVADGLSRKQRRTVHQPRLRGESYGELVQIDGSEHRWFESRAELCTLLFFIDDVTSKLMQLRFVPARARNRTSRPYAARTLLNQFHFAKCFRVRCCLDHSQVLREEELQAG